MELFKKRPLALCCFCAVVIMLAGLFMNSVMRTLSILLLSIALIIGLIFLIVLFARKAKAARIKNIVCLVTCLAMSLLLFIGIHLFLSKSETVDEFYGKNIHITGTVASVRHKTENYSALEVIIDSLDGKSCNVKAILEIDSHSNIDDSDKFSLVNNISRLSSEEYYLVSDGFNAKIECSSASEIAFSKVGNKNTIISFFKNINLHLQDVINEKTDERTGSFVGALLLGNRENLNDETIRDFRRLGISHMLALSGLHMAIIIGAFDCILKGLFVNKKLRCVILIFASLFYLAITGFSSSASRAVIMLCTVYILYLLKSDAESITSLFIALFLILLISPYALFDIGLWLSFFATLGIIIVSDIISALSFRLKKKPVGIQIAVKVFSSIAITLAAIFSVCAFSWLFFGETSIISPITNLIFSPIMTLIIILGMVLLIFSPIPIISGLVAKVLSFLCVSFETLASNISYQRGIVVSLRYDFVPYIIIPLCTLLIVFLLIKVKHKWVVVIPPALSIAAFIISLSAFNNAYADTGSAIYLRNNRNEAIIVSTVSQTSICDISSGGYYDLSHACAEATIGNTVEIENLILSHYHKYHPGAVKKVCNKYMIRNVYLPAPETEDEIEIFNQIVESLKASKVNRVIYNRENPIDAGNGYHICVSKTASISRSEHPLFGVCVSNETNSLTYVSSSALESDAFDNFIEGAGVLILGSHGAVVKPFEAADIPVAPQTLFFSSPDEMLGNKDLISYLNLLYQQGHEIIFDTNGRYEVNISKQTE